MFHDDDVVPDIDSKPSGQVLQETKQIRKMVEDAGMFMELVAPRLWFSPMTIDGAYTSNDPKARQYAIDRSLRTIDMADALAICWFCGLLAKEPMSASPRATNARWSCSWKRLTKCWLTIRKSDWQSSQNQVVRQLSLF
jgi:hypothetical protein